MPKEHEDYNIVEPYFPCPIVLGEGAGIATLPFHYLGARKGLPT
jgi:hypothetical protein